MWIVNDNVCKAIRRVLIAYLVLPVFMMSAQKVTKSTYYMIFQTLCIWTQTITKSALCLKIKTNK